MLAFLSLHPSRENIGASWPMRQVKKGMIKMYGCGELPSATLRYIPTEIPAEQVATEQGVVQDRQYQSNNHDGLPVELQQEDNLQNGITPY